MLQARLGKLLGLKDEEELVLLSPDEQRLWQVRWFALAHSRERGRGLNTQATDH
jgi:hypothetical protein